MDTKNKNSKPTRKTNRKNKSFKGKRGNVVGAPPKPIRFPKNPFTMETAFNMNGNQCHLSVRKKVDVLVASGELIQLKSRKQAKGGVGRPKAVFVKAENFNATKMERFGALTPVRRTATNTAIPTTKPAVVNDTDLVPNAPAPQLPVIDAEVVTEAPAAPAVNVEAAKEYVANLDVTTAPVVVGEPVMG